MRVIIHDFGSYHFPKQLACALAQRGHEVRHIFSGAEPRRCGNDIPEGLEDRLQSYPVNLARPFKRDSFFHRRQWSIEYGAAVANEVRSFQPHVVLSANTPLDSQRAIQVECKRLKIGFIYWLQDLLGLATKSILRKRLPVIGSLAGWYYQRLERQLLNQSNDVIVITDDFLNLTDAARVPRHRVHVIENWAPLEELPLLPRDNAWANRHAVGDKLCVLYAGLLGMKQNPHLLFALAKKLDSRDDVEMIVTAEGQAVEGLKAQVAEAGLKKIRFLPFQPYSELPAMLASADVLVALLDSDGSDFCVPSKVLTYMCAGRPLLLSVPRGNLAAKLVERNHAGKVVSPDDEAGFCKAALELLENQDVREQLGAAGRNYAENSFNIDTIADRFESIFQPYEPALSELATTAMQAASSLQGSAS